MARPHTFHIGQQRTLFFPNGSLSDLSSILPGRRLILITDQHVYRKHRNAFSDFDTIVLRAGEQYKVQATIDSLVERLIRMEADRKAVLVGVGGGVVTDLVGYLAAIYLRGVDVGFVPTTLLAMVDASIGGKNGVDVGAFKNLVGTTRQPLFLLHDLSLLSTLPTHEWSNGFAEIIKHAAIGDEAMFRELLKSDLKVYRNDPVKLRRLIARNVRYKFSVVQQDVSENGERKKLNFGHTLGHALEMQYELSHGEAISLGMMFAAHLSEKMNAFTGLSSLGALLIKYGLPVEAGFSAVKVLQSLKMDKKRVRHSIDFVLLKQIGKAEVCAIPIVDLQRFLKSYA